MKVEPGFIQIHKPAHSPILLPDLVRLQLPLLAACISDDLSQILVTALVVLNAEHSQFRQITFFRKRKRVLRHLNRELGIHRIPLQLPQTW